MHIDHYTQDNYTLHTNTHYCTGMNSLISDVLFNKQFQQLSFQIISFNQKL